MKRSLLVTMVLLLYVAALAHEFWLHPQKFYFTIREVASIRFRVGENFRGENWDGNNEKIANLLHYTPSDQVRDISAYLSAAKGDSIRLPLGEEGTHMVIFTSTNSFVTLEADKFNEYLKQDALDMALAYRKQHGEEQLKGTGYQQQSVKTIFQVGGKVTDACKRPTELPLDIIPEDNPYAVPLGTDSEKPVKIRFQVMYNQQPLANALVKIWYYTSPAKTQVKMDSTRTNRRGWITAERRPGPYMVSTVYMERNQTDTIAQWQRYASSVCFEYSTFFPGKTGRYEYQKIQK